MAHGKGGSGADAGHWRMALKWLTAGAQRRVRAWNENEWGPPFYKMVLGNCRVPEAKEPLSA